MGLLKLQIYNPKITKIESKIPIISASTTIAALTTVENKIPDVSSLVEKTDYNRKITEIGNKLTDHNYDKYITTPEFNKLAANIFPSRLKQAKLVTKPDFEDNLKSLKQKINSNKTKILLVEIELKKLQIFDSIYFMGKVILKDMVHKFISYFNQCTNILKGLVVLVLVVIFIFGNLKDYLMKMLQLLLQVIIASIHN